MACGRARGVFNDAVVKYLMTLVSVCLLIASTADAETSKCPRTKGKVLVYGVGSSTMGSPLGPILGKALDKRNIAFRKWGVASSGLARPDFHDWPSKVKTVVKKYDPEFFVISLGTNDYQTLWAKKKWVKFGSKKWKEIYAQRVDQMLEILSGPKRTRAVIWVGPVAFAGKRAEVRAPVVSEILRERVEAFEGPVVFYNGYKATTTKKGRPIAFFRPKGSKKKKRARTKDNIHLTTIAVRELLAKPVLELIYRCL